MPLTFTHPKKLSFYLQDPFVSVSPYHFGNIPGYFFLCTLSFPRSGVVVYRYGIIFDIIIMDVLVISAKKGGGVNCYAVYNLILVALIKPISP